MTVWSAIEEILNDNPNIMINIKKTYDMQSYLSITMTVLDQQTFRPIYNVRQIVDYKELKSQFGEPTYEDVITKYIENMCLELKTKMSAFLLFQEKEDD